MADEETVDVTLELTGKNSSGFFAQHSNTYKGVNKAAFAQIQKRGAEMLVALSDDLTSQPAEPSARKK